MFSMIKPWIKSWGWEWCGFFFSGKIYDSMKTYFFHACNIIIKQVFFFALVFVRSQFIWGSLFYLCYLNHVSSLYFFFILGDLTFLNWLISLLELCLSTNLKSILAPLPKTLQNSASFAVWKICWAINC